jgi:hypothetical protein
MNLKIRKIRQQIKTKPIIVFKNPLLVFYLPLILIQILFNRLKSSKTEVYLIEAKLSEIITTENNESIDCVFEIINNFDGFARYAEHRKTEDTELDESFILSIKQRFGRGDFAIVYLNNENYPLSYIFITTMTANITPVGLTLQLPENAFGIYDVYTFKAVRGKSYYSQLFNFSVSHMLKCGYESLWLWLMPHNIASVNVHCKLGLKRIIKILIENRNYGIVKKEIKNVDLLLSSLKKTC